MRCDFWSAASSTLFLYTLSAMHFDRDSSVVAMISLEAEPANLAAPKERKICTRLREFDRSGNARSQRHEGQSE
jgi:hypothetical protein